MNNPNVPQAIVASVNDGQYVLWLYARNGCVSVGTMMRNRSSHMPTRMHTEAKKMSGIVRSFAMARIGNGIRRLHVTISQNSGANRPEIFDQNTAISAASLPYHVTRYSVNVK